MQFSTPDRERTLGGRKAVSPEPLSLKEVAMSRKQYAVDTVRDEPVRLREQLDHIAAEGGRVVSVIWQPARQVTLEPGLQPYEVASGYVIISEHQLHEEGPAT